jgi:lipopolysaccharide biosynthesis glycosyltransferase
LIFRGPSEFDGTSHTATLTPTSRMSDARNGHVGRAAQEDRVQERIEALIRQHQKSRIWKQGVHQSSFVLALGNHTQPLDARWNVLQLGWNKAVPPESLKAGWVLHWNGEKKPWLRDGMYQDRWRPYTHPSVL